MELTGLDHNLTDRMDRPCLSGSGHTCASLLVQVRVSMKQVQLWTGHRDFSTTANIYAYLTSGELVESAGGQV